MGYYRYDPDAWTAYAAATAAKTHRDYGRASIREVGRKPDVIGIPRHWISIPKMAITLLLPSAIKWLFAVDPKRRFYSKCWIWTTMGQMQEMNRMYRRPPVERKTFQKNTVDESPQT